MKPPCAVVTLIIIPTFLLFSPVSPEQSTNASVKGRVLDPSKAVVPGAAVEVTNIDTRSKF